jgi:LL-diaminopimelate aminotransferase
VPRLTDRFRSLPVYALAGFPQKKRELLERGMDVIDLGAGDADLPAPPAAVERLKSAVDEPALNRYGFGFGHTPFREAIAGWVERRFGVKFDPYAELMPLIGSKEGISHLAFAFLQKGDVAIIPEPGYLAYVGGTLLAEAEPYMYPLRPRTSFLVDLDDVPPDVLDRTRLIYLNYPNNPTAATAPREYLEEMVRRCRERDILLVYDNAYSEMAYDGYVPPSIFEIPGARDVAIEFHSLSKTYNMTGWRVGWAMGAPELVGPLAKVKSFIDTGPFLAVQAAGVAALESWEEFLPRNLETFQARRDAAVEGFREAGFQLSVPRATMYLWIALPEGVASAGFAARLADEEGVMVLPGSSFGEGGEGFFRISFIAAPERMREAARRAGRVLASMRGANGSAAAA